MKIVKNFNKLLPIKIEVKNYSSIEIQNALFKMGYSWYSHSKILDFAGPYFYIDKNKIITYSCDDNGYFFNSHNGKEIKEEDIL